MTSKYTKPSFCEQVTISTNSCCKVWPFRPQIGSATLINSSRVSVPIGSLRVKSELVPQTPQVIDLADWPLNKRFKSLDRTNIFSFRKRNNMIKKKKQLKFLTSIPALKEVSRRLVDPKLKFSHHLPGNSASLME